MVVPRCLQENVNFPSSSVMFELFALDSAVVTASIAFSHQERDVLFVRWTDKRKTDGRLQKGERGRRGEGERKQQRQLGRCGRRANYRLLRLSSLFDLYMADDHAGHRIIIILILIHLKKQKGPSLSHT